MNIIPAIDIKNGKCVRLYQGNFDKETIYNEDPIFIAKQWEKMGAKIIHIVDLDGAKNGYMKNIKIIKKICENISVPIQVGGGIRSINVIKNLLSFGIKNIIVGTVFLENLDLFKDILKKYNSNIIVSIDVKNENLVSNGWIKVTMVNVFEILKEMKKFKIKKIIYTDILKDGTMSSPNFKNIKKIFLGSDIPLIISGGISSDDDIKKLSLIGIKEIIVGKALYEGKIKYVS